MMKTILQFGLYTSLVASIFTSCSRENILEGNEEKNTGLHAKNGNQIFNDSLSVDLRKSTVSPKFVIKSSLVHDKK